jgi:NADPH-dependent 2,4-dienoyl-CoA reductase/sulfur reductase-like enzyme
VTILFPEPGLSARLLPEAVARYLNQYFQEHGVQVMPGRLVRSLEPDEKFISLLTDQGESLQVDAVVAGLGIRPNTALAESAGLEVSNGILVDATLQTSHPDIYAAGDVANIYQPTLKMRQRLEHEENANLTGLLAGHAMAGQPEPYETLSSFYSSLFKINYDAVGLLDPRQEVVFDWEEPFVKGVIYYLNPAHQVTGVLLWNMKHGLDVARQMIAEGGVFQPQDLLKRIR